MLINFGADLPVWSAFSLADRTNGRAIGTLLRPSSSVTYYIVAKRCVLEQKLERL